AHRTTRGLTPDERPTRTAGLRAKSTTLHHPERTTSMTKTKTIITTLAAALTITTLAVGPTAASARKPPTTTLTYSIRFSPFFLFDLGKNGPTPGDQILSHDALYTRAGKKVGTDVMTCTVVTTAPSQASCNLTFAFATGT